MIMRCFSFLLVIVLLFLLELEIVADEMIAKHDFNVHHVLLPSKYSTPRTTPITHIMIHSISNLVSKPESPYEINDIRLLLMEHGVSAHYVIDRKGRVFQLVQENRVAFHAGRNDLPNAPFFDHRMNDYSIGIELMGIGTKEEMVPIVSEKLYNQLDISLIGFTKEQYLSLSNLLAYLYKRYPTIKKSRYHVIGHEDYAPNRKSDPGRLFNWSDVGL